MTTLSAPNIFTYATKELSQDAFLCWLFCFADKQYQDSNYRELHLLAIELLRSFVSNTSLEIEEIVVKKQENKIDIWLEINSNLLVIIEDKTNSQAGTGQLDKYFQLANQYCKTNNFGNPICIYFKTGNEAARVFNRADLNRNWKYFSLEHLIQIFSSYEEKINHPYFQDFFQMNHDKFKLNQNFEEHISEEKIKKLGNNVIEAFYTKLELDEVFKNWNYNDSIGNRRYYSNDYSNVPGEANVYLQLDRMDLRLKVDLCKLRDEKGKTYKKFQTALKQNDIKSIYSGVRSVFENHSKFKGIIVKPAKYALHNFLTFANIPQEHWLNFNSNGTINYAQTKDKLQSINNDLQEAITQHQSEILEIIDSGFAK